MKKPSLKNLLSVSGAVLFTLCCIWLVAQSNANDDASIMIDTSKYTATQHIQEVHLNNKDFSDRVGLKNLNGVSLGIGEIGSNGRAVSPKNGVGDDASVIAGVSNRNSGGEASLIVGGERNVINDNLNNSVIMGGKANQVKASSVILLTSSGVIANQNGVAVGVNKGTIEAPNALIFAGENTSVEGEDSMAIGSNITVNSPGTFVFNGSSTPSPLSELLSGYTSHAFIIKADNGLIVGGTKNKASAVDLTVSGAVKIGDAKGVALNDRNIKGAVFRVKCSSPADASCLCANENGIIKSISSNPACDGVCKNGNGSCESGNLCGSASRIDYAAAETDRRANTTFCAVGAHLKEEIVGSSPLALHKNPRPSFPGPGKNVQWTCVSDFQDSVMMVCIAKRKDIKKENAECGTYNGISFTGAMMTAWPAGGTFCKKGTPTPTNPAFPMTGKPVTWTCGGANLIPVQCSANGCNRCSKDGFPYCFPVDLDPSCNLIPVQPEEAHCGAAINTCNPGNVEDVPDTAAEYKWKCNWKLTSKMCSKPKSTTTYNCIGSDFANAYPVLGDDKNLTANTAKKLVASDTSAKCEWLCNSGYTLQNGACVKLENFKCIGVIPENAMLIPGDDQSLPQDTEISLVPFNTPAKCEYICKLRDFVYDASTKKCKPSSSGGGENHVKKCSPNPIVPSNLTANCQFETSEFNCLKHAGRDGHSRYGGALSQGQDLGIRLDGTRHPGFIVEFFEGKPKGELATYIGGRNPAYYRLETVCVWE